MKEDEKKKGFLRLVGGTKDDSGSRRAGDTEVSRRSGETEVMEFPCSYPLKVMGKNTKEFYAVVNAIIERHVPGGGSIAYAGRTSSGEKYLSVTATFTAESREQLDALYTDLNKHELVLFTL